jgi:hypothetical protein
MICILGHRSGFPCPICLVPRKEQSKLTKSWPMRTVSETENILSQVNNAVSTSERDAILKEQSLRNVRVRHSSWTSNITSFDSRVYRVFSSMSFPQSIQYTVLSLRTRCTRSNKVSGESICGHGSEISCQQQVKRS